MDKPFPRKLTAILYADVVAYSRLMGEDEDRTHRDLSSALNLLINLIEEHGGRKVHEAGDAVLAEFPSAKDAVECAVTFQRKMAEDLHGVPEDRRLQFRVGINLGDVIHDREDIYGDGVNVAARLESIAETGGICISHPVFLQVQGNQEIGFESIGEQSVKNIEHPVMVYRILLEPGQAGKLHSRVRNKSYRLTWIVSGIAAFLIIGLLIVRPWAPIFEPALESQMQIELPDNPSLVVLPFSNISDDLEQEYFADGMTDDLLTGLSKMPELFVISSNTSFTYKNKVVKIRDVAEELGVRYVLEGSVRRAGDTVRINAQLIDALSGFHVWAEKYDGKTDDVFQLQDEVVARIVSSLAQNLTPGARHAETNVPEAYDQLLQGMKFFRILDPASTVTAIEFFSRAAELDSRYHRAYAALAAAYFRIADLSWSDKAGMEFPDVLRLMKHNLAIALENPTSLALNVSANWKLWNGEHQNALNEINRAIALNPNNPDNFDTKAYILVYTGPASQVEENARHAMRLNPNYPADYLRNLGRGLFHQERYSEAAKLYERAAKRDPNYEYNYSMLSAIYGHLGNLASAEKAHRKFLELRSDQEGGAFTVQSIALWKDYAELTHLLRYQQGLRLAGVPEGIVASDMEVNYLDLVTKADGEFSVEGAKKIDLNEAMKKHDQGYIFIDNRSSRGYGQGHIPNAINLPFKTGLTRESLQDLVTKNEPAVFYCDGEGCYKSAHGAAKAVTWGYTNIFYFAGGMPAWKKAGLYVEKQI